MKHDSKIDNSTPFPTDSSLAIKILQARLPYLDSLKAEIRNMLKKAPHGSLRTSQSHGTTQYYHRLSSSDRCGKYIPKANKTLAASLAEKEYNMQLLTSIRQEMDAIQVFLNQYPKTTVEQIYGTLTDIRQELVTPIEETDEMFLERWSSHFYIENGYPIENTDFITDRGETVRSKSELIIANMLAKEEIPYRYECPVYLENYGTVYPDFTVLNLTKRKEYLWEHHGLMDDPEYSENTIRKLHAYELNGYFPGENLIQTFETRTTPLNSTLIRTMIERYLK